MEVVIRPLALSEYHACEALQRRVWQMSDERDVVPLHMLLAVHTQGGVLLGAFGGNELVGYVFGFAGLTDEGQVKHCSHMMGVLPEYQSQGVGYQLKLAQREFALGQGLDLITWTYDPLESRNAYLNLGKLGVISRSYIQDLYGPMTDGLNAGLPSDRFRVEWRIGSKWVRRRLAGEESRVEVEMAAPGNIPGHTTQGALTPGRLSLRADAVAIAVQIPADYQTIKATDQALALDWRLATRQIFEAYFEKGYVAADFLTSEAKGERKSLYVLRRDQQMAAQLQD
jgi:predicted GNAT superfamily acetyltransferase